MEVVVEKDRIRTFCVLRRAEILKTYVPLPVKNHLSQRSHVQQQQQYNFSLRSQRFPRSSATFPLSTPISAPYLVSTSSIARGVQLAFDGVSPLSLVLRERSRLEDQSVFVKCVV